MTHKPEPNRRCDHCGAGMTEGYCIDGGAEYYCADDCLHAHYTPAQWSEMYADGESDSYWTTWEDEE